MKNKTKIKAKKRVMLNYAAFLKSNYWNYLKCKYKQNKCALCDKTEYLVLHHVDYKKYDSPKRMLTVCNLCHYKLHYKNGIKLTFENDGYKIRYRLMELLNIKKEHELKLYLRRMWNKKKINKYRKKSVLKKKSS